MSQQKKGASNGEFPIVKFLEGEAVRSLDQGKLYEAKVVRVGADDQYFIHYQGWNKKWDKWVHASLLMAEGPEAVKLSAKLAEQDKKIEEAKENGKRAAKLSVNSAENDKRKKIKSDMDRSLETIDASLVSFKLPIPFTLKKVLVDDWEKVTQTDPQMLVSFKKGKLSVSDIISEYLDFKSKKGGAAQGSHEKLVELFEGLKSYFDTCLPVLLLYRQEREQYLAIKASNPGKLSDIYGGEHLLRLFTKLPIIFSQTRISPFESSQTQFGDFLKYFQKNSSSLLLGEYDIVESDAPAPQEEEAEEAATA